MKTGLGGVIVYVPDAVEAAAFYERAFGFERKFVSDGNDYCEMQGDVPLGFVREESLQKLLPEFVKNRPGARPAGFEILVTSKDVDAAFARAVQAGATPVAEPHDMPWGQRVSYVRDLNGVLVEICSPWSAP
ncbi:lyase [Sorangium cellulosum]|uniref:Lyase n=1 Tax=Sorangium cellulosum TaxID=56 RepID=A0A150PU96_SORCE|nr:VOC family protein [Sorangium cellulosum]KYF59269.1 lyase [Sorangium cellulosum]KYG01185.1 lyase [Sorangium cellulosum]